CAKRTAGLSSRPTWLFHRVFKGKVGGAHPTSRPHPGKPELRPQSLYNVGVTHLSPRERSPRQRRVRARAKEDCLWRKIMHSVTAISRCWDTFSNSTPLGAERPLTPALSRRERGSRRTAGLSSRP